MANQAFTPEKNDAAMAMLGQIFGPVMERFGSSAAGTSWTGALLEAFRFYNNGVLFFGAIIMGYVTVRRCYQRLTGQWLRQNWFLRVLRRQTQHQRAFMLQAWRLKQQRYPQPFSQHSL
jgi:hypothetical protein